MTYSKSILLNLFCLLLVSLSVNAQKMDIKNFDGISVAAGLHVELIASDKNYVDVEMIKGDRDDITIKVRNGTLRLKAEASTYGKTAKANIVVYYDGDINSIDVSSASRLSSEDLIKGKKLELNASSAASCTINIDVDELDVNVSSAARITVMGDANTQDIDISSAAKYMAKELISKDVDISASSGAKAEIYCSERIDAEANSAAKISYYGNPKKQDIESGEWSGGSIKAK